MLPKLLDVPISAAGMRSRPGSQLAAPERRASASVVAACQRTGAGAGRSGAAGLTIGGPRWANLFTAAPPPFQNAASRRVLAADNDYRARCVLHAVLAHGAEQRLGEPAVSAAAD